MSNSIVISVFVLLIVATLSLYFVGSIRECMTQAANALNGDNANKKPASIRVCLCLVMLFWMLSLGMIVFSAIFAESVMRVHYSIFMKSFHLSILLISIAILVLMQHALVIKLPKMLRRCEHKYKLGLQVQKFKAIAVWIVVLFVLSKLLSLAAVHNSPNTFLLVLIGLMSLGIFVLWIMQWNLLVKIKDQLVKYNEKNDASVSRKKTVAKN